MAKKMTLSRAGGPLEDGRHEHFAQLVAGGETLAKAYVLAGYSEKGAIQSGNRLLRRPEVAARVQQLKNAVAERRVEKVAVDRAWVVARLKENVQRAMQVEPVRDREGNPTGRYTYQGAVANKALELLGKELGMFEAKPNNGEDLEGSLFQRFLAAEERLRKFNEAEAASNSANRPGRESTDARMVDGGQAIATGKGEGNVA